MTNRHLFAATFVAATLHLLPVATAQPHELAFDEVLRLVDERAPELGSTDAELATARARVEGADKWRLDPTLSLAAGPRLGDRTTADVDIGLMQPIAPGGRPAARTAVEEARSRVTTLETQVRRREVHSRAARLFAHLLYWQQRAAIASRNLALVTEVEAVANRRKEVGDVGGLDPSLALLTRTQAEAHAAEVEAQRLAVEAELRWLLGARDQRPIVARGDLQGLARGGRSGSRPDVELAAARVEVEQHRQHLARRDRVPTFAVGLAGGREEGATVLKGVLELTLPIFARGQPELLEAVAAEELRREQAGIAEARAAHEVRAATKRAAVLDEAVANFSAGGLTAIEKTAEIAAASYRAGAIPLPDLLVVRRELVAAERDFTELLLLAALARIDVLDSSGSLTQPHNR